MAFLETGELSVGELITASFAELTANRREIAIYLGAFLLVDVAGALIPGSRAWLESGGLLMLGGYFVGQYLLYRTMLRRAGHAGAESGFHIFRFVGGMLPGGATVPTTSCSPMVADGDVNMADVFAGGASAMIGPFPIPVLNATQADVDFDGDGLETLEIVSGSDCQPVVVACIDGDGTRIEGHACTSNERIADGWSSAFDLSAAPTRLVP